MSEESHQTPEFQRSPHLRSGMEIVDSSLREALGKRQIAAYQAWYTSWGRAEKIEIANDAANSIGGLGVEVLRNGDYGRDYKNRCAHFAFGEQSHEEWAVPQADLPLELWLEPVAFLKQHGYEIVDAPTAGDIVAYTNALPEFVTSEEAAFDYFGVLEPGGTVVSKFNQGPVVRHAVEAVPSQFGSRVYFFRKIVPVPDTNSAAH